MRRGLCEVGAGQRARPYTRDMSIRVCYPYPLPSRELLVKVHVSEPNVGSLRDSLELWDCDVREVEPEARVP